MEEAARSLNCKVGHTPFKYLGLFIGGNLICLSFFIPMIDMIHAKLSGWKSRNILMGGCLILLKVASSTLSVYFLSFFKAPTHTISQNELIFKYCVCVCVCVWKEGVI